MKINYPDLVTVSKKIGIFLLCAACGWFLKARLTPSGGMPNMAGGEVYVVAKKAFLKDVATFDSKISYIESLNEVNLLPQVTGTIENVLFDEGSIVKAGDVLFEIDDAKYQAAFDLAKARLDSAEANYVKAKRDYDRQVTLSSEKFASKATFDSAETLNIRITSLPVTHDNTVKSVVQGHIDKTADNATKYAAFFNGVVLPGTVA